MPIYYEEIGNGRPIVLVHGFAQSIESWHRTGWIAFLTAQGRRVVGIDPRGHGRSGKPHNAAAYDGHQVGDDLIVVMDAIGLERTDFMGIRSAEDSRSISWRVFRTASARWSSLA